LPEFFILQNPRQSIAKALHTFSLLNVHQKRPEELFADAFGAASNSSGLIIKLYSYNFCFESSGTKFRKAEHVTYSSIP